MKNKNECETEALGTASEIHINDQFWQPRIGKNKSISDAQIIDADNNITLSINQFEQRINDFLYKLLRQLSAECYLHAHQSPLLDAHQPKQLIALIANNDLNFVVSYLALLRAKHTILLLDSENSITTNEVIIEQYQANYLLDNDEVIAKNKGELALHQDLALLLSTSGSTGSSKFVKLSYDNLAANCQAICQYLPILSSDTVVTTLPLHYSFGLSILHSHLAVGATIVLTNASPLQSQLWTLYKQYQPQSFYGVPFSFELLHKLNFARLPLTSIRYFAQAGGKLSAIVWNALVDLCQQSSQPEKQQLFIMYGQTEATARIAYLSPDKTPQKLNCIGQAIPNGELAIFNEDNKRVNDANTEGELCYRGKNVFIGYANTIKDLAVAENIEWLHTGDIAECDKDGDYKITGRLKRITKILGKRINLDEVERYIGSIINTKNGIENATINIDFAISSTDDLLTLFYSNINSSTNSNSRKQLMSNEKISYLQQKISDFCHINTRYVNVTFLPTLPRKSNGKIDYMTLNRNLNPNLNLNLGKEKE